MKLNEFSGIVLGIAAAAFAQDPEDYSTWANARPITINTSSTGANTTGDVANFPLLVRLGSAQADVFAQAGPGGASLRFRRLPGPHLKYQIESWDSAGQTALIWVSVDSIKANNGSQQIWMYWGKNGAADSSSGRNVFHADYGFVGAWHMGGPAGNRPNATGGLPAIPGGTGYNGRSVTGVVGTADSLVGGTSTGAGEHFRIDTLPSFTTGFTYSAWHLVTSNTNSWWRFFDFGNGEASENFFFGRQSNTANLWFDVFPSQTLQADNALVTGQWKLYSVTLAAADLVNFGPSPTKVFVDGDSAAGAEIVTNIPDNVKLSNFLGRSNWAADAYLRGLLDEVQVSRVERSPSWIRLSFQSQRQGSAMLTIGPRQAPVSIASSRAGAAGGLRVRRAGAGYVFSLPENLQSGARLAVLDSRGRAVWSAVTEERGEAAWNGLSAGGRALSRGVYFVTISAASGENGPARAWRAKIPHSP